MPLSAANSSAKPGGAVSIRDVRKSFGNVTALKGISLEIAPSEFFSLLGPSGCGKTTLLRIIGGLDAPDLGGVFLDGYDLLARPAHERPVNTVFQSYALFPHLSVRENVSFGLRMKKVVAHEIARRSDAIMELVEITNLANRKPGELSGGQRQRVALARALVNEPQVLLLDEPLAALDQKLRTQLQSDLHALQRRLGLTFIYVTHDQEEALSLSDRIAVMEHGDVAQIGAPEEVYNHPANRFVAEFLGGCNLIEAHVEGERAKTAFGEFRVNGAAVGKATLAFRPERAQVGPGENSFSGKIVDVTFTGAQTQLSVECGPNVVRAALLNQTDSAYKPGQNITLSVASTDLTLLAD